MAGAVDVRPGMAVMAATETEGGGADIHEGLLHALSVLTSEMLQLKENSLATLHQVERVLLLFSASLILFLHVF